MSIEIMTNKLVEVLQENNPTIYLFGSCVLDDYKQGWSDIDIICLTEKSITDKQAEELLMLRQAMVNESGNKNFRLFEGIIAPLSVCMQNKNDTVVYWGTSGQRIVDSFTIDVFSLISLQKYGKLLYGQDVREKLPVPNDSEITKAVGAVLKTVRKYAVITDETLYSAGWLFDIARCIYTLKTGDIIAKTQAGKWALEQNICPEPTVIQKAIEIRENAEKYKDDKETQEWLKNLGKHVQLFADVLEEHLNKGLK